jgi:hypothetical protein
VEVLGPCASWKEQAPARAEPASAQKVDELSQLVQQLLLALAQQQKEQVAPRAVLDDVKPVAAGLIEVQDGEVVDLRVGEQFVALHLNGNARAVCAKEPLDWHAGHLIEVRGKNNELVVSADMTFAGQILFAQPDAALTLRIAAGATCTLISDQPLALSEGAVLECTGDGAVQFGCDVQFGKQPSSARLLLSHHVLASPLTGRDLSIGGVGSLVLNDRAGLQLGENQKLTIGTTSRDDINVVLAHEATIACLAAGAQINFVDGLYDLVLLDTSSIVLDGGSCLALNAANKASCVARRVRIKKGSKIIIAQDAVCSLGKQEALCAFDIAPSSIIGQGFVMYAGLAQRARLQPHGSVKRHCSMGGFARALINKRQDFEWATLFEDDAAQVWAFLPDQAASQQLAAGRCIEVPADASIIHENKATETILITQQGHFVELGRREALLQSARTRMMQSNEQTELASLRAFLSSSGA